VRSSGGTVWPAAGLTAAFCLLALLNSGGYRYGTADQAFYIPTVLKELQPGLFPRDGVLLATQDPFTMFDELTAAMVRTTGVSLPALFVLAHFAGLMGLALGAMALGGRLFSSRWTTAAFVLALSLRHRIPKTGANTLEGYLHPRMIAFALGVTALAAFLRGRSTLSLVVVAAAALLHPTTAMWFGIWLLVAVIVSDASLRPAAMAVAIVCGLGALWAISLGPMRPRLATMDDLWIAAFQSKDYIFPTDWTIGTWTLNVALVATIVLVFRPRQSLGMLAPRETGVVAGSLALAVLFLISLPFVAMRVALAVQLQTSRVFWMLDFLAVAYLVWLVVESPWRRSLAVASRQRQRIGVAVVAVAALARGSYVMFVEHPGRPVVERDFPADRWTDVMRWLRTKPIDTHVLADPGHAWRYGTSVRVSAERDVYLEDVKDASMALYSRDVAARVVERASALGSFDALTAEHARELGRRYALDLLVADRAFELPVVYDNGQFKVYMIRSSAVPTNR
jgi:hypothetical protein